MRTNQSSHRVVTRAWISGESPALEALSRHAKRSTLHEHSDSCARQAVCKRADRTELSHSAIIAQGDLRAYRCMSATGTRGECTVASNICAPNDNVQALSLYDNAGNWVSTTNPLGAIGTAVYDGANKVIARVDALGSRASFSYDAANNRTALVDPLGNTASSVF